jgi:predicted PurR-regulated permease PerM/GAF domain-containing protein
VLDDAGRKNPILSGNQLLVGIVLAAVLHFGRDVFIPLALASLLSFLLVPAANRLERWRFRRTPATLTLVFILVVGAGAIGWLVLNQIYNLATDLPRYQLNINAKIQSLHLDSAGRLSTTIRMLNGIGDQVLSAGAAGQNAAPQAGTAKSPVPVTITQPHDAFASFAHHSLSPALHVVTIIFIAVVFLIFFLNGRDDLRDRGFRLAGRGRMHLTSSAVEDAGSRVSRYLRMQLVVNLCYGTIAGSALWVIGVPNPFLWGVMISVLRFIPYVGILMAAAGPLLLSIAVAPGWWQLLWTVLTFAVLEIVTANFLEPTLYGISTGISPIAVLIAALFWTLLWGFPGLLISTPLTVCLVVMGRQVPQLEFLHILFGEDAILTPAERFYQRVLAFSSHEAQALLEEELKQKPRDRVYDEVVIPTLSMIQAARRAEEMTGERAEAVLNEIEEIIEENTRIDEPIPALRASQAQIACVPCRDYADELACTLAARALGGDAQLRVLSRDAAVPDLLSSLEQMRPAAICVIGIPPNAIRHIRMRCHQIRARLPETKIVACLPSQQSELTDLRSRIATEDAQHVVGSLQLLRSYLLALLHPQQTAPEPQPQLEQRLEAKKELSEGIQEMEKVEASDAAPEEAFTRMVTNLARTFDAPIALIQSCNGDRHFWEAQCGLPENDVSAESHQDFSLCRRMAWSEPSVVVPDTQKVESFADDPFIQSKGIRFCAAAPLKTFDGQIIGAVSVFDTRPRQITEEQKETLVSLADAVMTAIELRETSAPNACTPASRKTA